MKQGLNEASFRFLAFFGCFLIWLGKAKSELKGEKFQSLTRFVFGVLALFFERDGESQSASHWVGILPQFTSSNGVRSCLLWWWVCGWPPRAVALPPSGWFTQRKTARFTDVRRLQPWLR